MIQSSTFQLCILINRVSFLGLMASYTCSLLCFRVLCCLQMCLHLFFSVALCVLDKQVVTKWKIPFSDVKTRSMHVLQCFFSSLCMVYGSTKCIILDWDDTKVASYRGEQTREEPEFDISVPGLRCLQCMQVSRIHLMKACAVVDSSADVCAGATVETQ